MKRQTTEKAVKLLFWGDRKQAKLCVNTCGDVWLMDLRCLSEELNY